MATKARVNLRPVGDHIVIRPDEKEERSPGGIVLPDKAKEEPSRGTVLAVGCGHLLRDGTRVPLEPAEGDLIAYERGSGHDIKIEGETYIVIREGDVLLIID